MNIRLAIQSWQGTFSDWRNLMNCHPNRNEWYASFFWSHFYSEQCPTPWQWHNGGKWLDRYYWDTESKEWVYDPDTTL